MHMYARLHKLEVVARVLPLLLQGRPPVLFIKGVNQCLASDRCSIYTYVSSHKEKTTKLAMRYAMINAPNGHRVGECRGERALDVEEDIGRRVPRKDAGVL